MPWSSAWHSQAKSLGFAASNEDQIDTKLTHKTDSQMAPNATQHIDNKDNGLISFGAFALPSEGKGRMFESSRARQSNQCLMCGLQVRSRAEHARTC